ncbi:MAG: stimulus-sensing domain-containing protein [Pseudomonadota bacterium]
MVQSIEALEKSGSERLRAWLAPRWRLARRAASTAAGRGFAVAESMTTRTAAGHPVHLPKPVREALDRGQAGYRRFMPRALPFFQWRSITMQMFLLNTTVFIVLVILLFAFSKAESWLVTAKRDSLHTNGEIVAAAIAAKSTAPQSPLDWDNTILDPQRLDTLPLTDGLQSVAFSIDPAEIAPIFNKLVGPTGSRAQIFDTNRRLLLDSEDLSVRPSVGSSSGAAAGLPQVNVPPHANGPVWMLVTWMRYLLPRNHAWVPRRTETIASGNFDELRVALTGSAAPSLIVNELGQHIVSVAIPIDVGGNIRGALVLSTKPGEFDQLILSEYYSLWRVVGFAFILMALLTAFFAYRIGRPLHRLSEAADAAQHNLQRRQELPDFTHRKDEIGDLSRTFSAMTNALYRRLETSERFAADVAHELKNPLASMRSAGEALSIVKTPEAREKLTKTITSDVTRMVRLIDDISSACRADAESARVDTEAVQIDQLLSTLVEMFNGDHVEDDQRVTLAMAPELDGSQAKGLRPIVEGHSARLAQVIRNLLANALSFSPADGVVAVTCQLTDAWGSDGATRFGAGKHRLLQIVIDDDGPGIPEESLEAIFRRFYTDRPDPETNFGNNSGLGLSISREIVEAHGGTLHAENLSTSTGGLSGARFVITLPLGTVRRTGANAARA